MDNIKMQMLVTFKVSMMSSLTERMTTTTTVITVRGSMMDYPNNSYNHGYHNHDMQTEILTSRGDRNIHEEIMIPDQTYNSISTCPAVTWRPLRGGGVA